MDYYSSHITKLIEELSKLPGVGAKSAQRLAFHIINRPIEEVQRLSDTIIDARKNVRYCKECFTLTDDELCPICKNDARDHKTIMVVENTRDLAAYEKTGKYDGVYHVLHGAISPMLGIGPGDIKLKELMTRLQGDVNEVIIATNSSLEGETTAMYISKLIKRPVSKSVGLPAGYRWAEIWNILMKLLCCVPWKAAWSCNEDKMHIRSVMQFQSICEERL